MNNIYFVGKSNRGNPTITIHRKPSEIPNHIDWELLQLAGKANMDGPNNVVIYEFLFPKNITDAEDYMKSSLWEKGEHHATD